MSALDLDDFVLWAAIGVVAGGRLGYVFFYDFARFAADPLSLAAVWQGGMSFHGGIAGVTLAMIAFAVKRGIPILSLFDVVAAGVPAGLGLVRIANFIKPELWGRATDMPWGIVFPGAGDAPRHPSQLYEAALEGVVLFIVLRVLTHRLGALKRPGLVSGVFALGYGLSRIAVENFREPDAHIGFLTGGWLTMGMVLSLPLVIFGLGAIARSRKPRSS
jgi:phosphatidylglycerol:prolipoprotein diacylglycerol transferase